MAFFISEDLGLLCRLNSVIEKFHSRGSVCSLKIAAGVWVAQECSWMQTALREEAWTEHSWQENLEGKVPCGCPGQSPLKRRSQGSLGWFWAWKPRWWHTKKRLLHLFLQILGCSIPRHSEAKHGKLWEIRFSVHLVSLSRHPWTAGSSVHQDKKLVSRRMRFLHQSVQITKISQSWWCRIFCYHLLASLGKCWTSFLGEFHALWRAPSPVLCFWDPQVRKGFSSPLPFPVPTFQWHWQ